MRAVGWQRLLNEYVLDSQKLFKRFGYTPGTFDCCVFAGNWVKTCTGKDLLTEYRGKYRTMDEARALLLQLDGSLLDALKIRLGEPVHPAKAHRGDIAYRAAEEACGIYFTSGARMMALFLGQGGFALFRANDTDWAFRV